MSRGPEQATTTMHANQIMPHTVPSRITHHYISISPMALRTSTPGQSSCACVGRQCAPVWGGRVPLCGEAGCPVPLWCYALLTATMHHTPSHIMHHTSHAFTAHLAHQQPHTTHTTHHASHIMHRMPQTIAAHGTYHISRIMHHTPHTITHLPQSHMHHTSHTITHHSSCIIHLTPSYIKHHTPHTLAAHISHHTSRITLCITQHASHHASNAPRTCGPRLAESCSCSCVNRRVCCWKPAHSDCKDADSVWFSSRSSSSSAAVASTASCTWEGSSSSSRSSNHLRPPVHGMAVAAVAEAEVTSTASCTGVAEAAKMSYTTHQYLLISGREALQEGR